MYSFDKTSTFLVLRVFALLWLLTSSLQADILLDLGSSPAVIVDSVVRVGDIAKVSGDSAHWRKTIEDLDLDQLASGNACTITRRQIELRIVLAGYQDRVLFKGQDSVQVSKGSAPNLQQDLETRIAQELCRQFAIEPKHLTVRLQTPEQVKALLAKLRGSPFEVAVLLQSKLPLGSTRLDVELRTGSNQSFIAQLDCFVVVSQMVAVAAEPIPQGTEITDNMIESVIRPLSNSRALLSQNEVVGRLARRRIPQHSTFAESDLSQVKEVVLRPNTLVDVVISLGNSEIRLRDARLMTSGRIGDKVTLRNPRSGRDFSAVLVSQNLAKIPSIY